MVPRGASSASADTDTYTFKGTYGTGPRPCCSPSLAAGHGVVVDSTGPAREQQSSGGSRMSVPGRSRGSRGSRTFYSGPLLKPSSKAKAAANANRRGGGTAPPSTEREARPLA